MTIAPTATYLAIAAPAFAVALLLLGPATQHPQAGSITHAAHVAVLLAGYVSLGMAGLSWIKRKAVRSA